MLLLNAFSLNMLSTEPGHQVDVRIREIDAHTARLYAIQGLTSAVGHAPTAAIFSEVLDVPVPTARATVSLKAKDRAIVGQYSGPRLEEGATTLPPGAKIKWLRVAVTSHYDQDGNTFPSDDDDIE